MIGDQIAEEMVTASFRYVGKLTISALKAALKLLIVKALGGGIAWGAKKIKGPKTSIKQLSKDGAPVDGIEVSKDEIKDFDKYARKYKMPYSLVREKSDPEHYFLTFRSRDLNKLEMLSKDLAKSESKQKSPSLDEKIKAAAEKAHGINEHAREEKKKERTHQKEHTR